MMVTMDEKDGKPVIMCESEIGDVVNQYLSDKYRGAFVGRLLLNCNGPMEAKVLGDHLGSDGEYDLSKLPYMVCDETAETITFSVDHYKLDVLVKRLCHLAIVSDLENGE